MKIANIGLGLMAAALSVTVLGTAASAQPAMMSPEPAMTVDCTKAGDMMSQAGKMDSGMTMTGDVDKDFMAMAMMHEKGMMMMQQVEVQCGKDPKVKAAATKSMHDSQMRLQMFHDQGQS